MVRLDGGLRLSRRRRVGLDDGWAQRVTTEEKGRGGILRASRCAPREGRAPAAPQEAANRVVEDPRAPNAAGARRDATQVHDDAMAGVG